MTLICIEPFREKALKTLNQFLKRQIALSGE